eukprot:SAG11_NODE_5201_length_1632_cov_1.174821_2_plen_281_part_00
MAHHEENVPLDGTNPWSVGPDWHRRRNSEHPKGTFIATCWAENFIFSDRRRNAREHAQAAGFAVPVSGPTDTKVDASCSSEVAPGVAYIEFVKALHESDHAAAIEIYHEISRRTQSPRQRSDNLESPRKAAADAATTELTPAPPHSPRAPCPPRPPRSPRPPRPLQRQRNKSASLSIEVAQPKPKLARERTRTSRPGWVAQREWIYAMRGVLPSSKLSLAVERNSRVQWAPQTSLRRARLLEASGDYVGAVAALDACVAKNDQVHHISFPTAMWPASYRF